MLINAQSASLCNMLAADSSTAETNAASSFDRSPAMDQIYQIPNYFFYFIQTVEFDWAQSPECVSIFEKNVKKLTCSALSTWVSKRQWVGRSKPVNTPLPSHPPPSPPLPMLPLPSPPLSGKCRVFSRRYRRFRPRPKSPNENSPGRNLWNVFLNFFASIFCLFFCTSPSPSNKAGWLSL